VRRAVGYGNLGVIVLGRDGVMVGVVLVGLLVFVEVRLFWWPGGMILVDGWWEVVEFAMLAPLA
jgi:hypothetical protein